MEERRPTPPDPLKRELQHVDFRPVDPDAPGAGPVTFEGTYTNAQSQRFHVTVAARREDEEFEEYRKELLVAFLAYPDDAPPDQHAEKTNGRRKPLLAQLLEEDVREEEGTEADEQVIGVDVDVVCDSLPDSAQREELTMVGLFDPPIVRNHKHCYCGQDRVVAWASGNVTLGGLTDSPHQVSVPPKRNRDANRACWVRGEAESSNYGLEGWWYRVTC